MASTILLYSQYIPSCLSCDQLSGLDCVCFTFVDYFIRILIVKIYVHQSNALSHLHHICDDAMAEFALGATAVCVGRELMGPLMEGSQGVTARIHSMTLELKSIMARTGARSLSEIDPSVIHFKHF